MVASGIQPVLPGAVGRSTSAISPLAVSKLRQRRRLCAGQPDHRLAPARKWAQAGPCVGRDRETIMRRSLGRAALGVCVALVVSAPALAQEKVWRHGIIEAKSDA